MKYDVSSRKEADADHTYLKLDLITNSTTQETRKFVTYNLVFTNSTDARNTLPMLNEAFHSENGTLLLDFVHSPPPVTIAGTKEQLLYAYRADPSTKTMIRGLTFDSDVVYHVHVRIMTVDNIRNIIAPGKEPTADFVISGDMPSSAREVRVVPEFPFAAPIFAASVAIITFMVKLARREDAHALKN